MNYITRYNKIGDLQDQIKKLNYLDESTNTSAALDMARTSVFGKTGDRLGIPNVVLMLTDGDPSNLTNPFRLGSTIAFVNEYNCLVSMVILCLDNL